MCVTSAGITRGVTTNGDLLIPEGVTRREVRQVRGKYQFSNAQTFKRAKRQRNVANALGQKCGELRGLG